MKYIRKFDTLEEYQAYYNQNIGFTALSGYMDNNNLVVKQKPFMYTVTVTSANTVMGSVTGGGEYLPNSEPTIKAIPFDGYMFSGWYEGSRRRSGLAEFTFPPLTANRNFQAKFAVEPPKCTVTIGDNMVDFGEGGLGIEPDAGITRGGMTVYVGNNVTVEVTQVNPGYTFAGWYDSPNADINTQSPLSSNESYTLTAYNDITVYPYFRYIPQLIYVSLTCNPVEGGNATVSWEDGDNYLYDSLSVSVTATPNSGYTFQNWMLNGEVISTQANGRLYIPAHTPNNSTLTVNFTSNS